MIATKSSKEWKRWITAKQNRLKDWAPKIPISLRECTSMPKSIKITSRTSETTMSLRKRRNYKRRQLLAQRLRQIMSCRENMSSSISKTRRAVEEIRQQDRRNMSSKKTNVHSNPKSTKDSCRYLRNHHLIWVTRHSRETNKSKWGRQAISQRPQLLRLECHHKDNTEHSHLWENRKKDKSHLIWKCSRPGARRRLLPRMEDSPSLLSRIDLRDNNSLSHRTQWKIKKTLIKKNWRRGSTKLRDTLLELSNPHSCQQSMSQFVSSKLSLMVKTLKRSRSLKTTIQHSLFKASAESSI